MDGFLAPIIMTLVLGIISFFIKKSFDGLEQRLNHYKDIIRDFSKEVSELRQMTANLHHEILTKFSNWEDRIKGILQEIELKRCASKEVNLKEVSDPFIKLDQLTQKELENVKRDLTNLKSKIKALRPDSSTKEIVQALAHDFKELEHLVNEVSIYSQNATQRHEKMLNSIYSACRELLKDQKDLRKRLKNQEDKTSKIKLF